MHVPEYSAPPYLSLKASEEGVKAWESHDTPVPALYGVNGPHQRSKIRGDRGL